MSAGKQGFGPRIVRALWGHPAPFGRIGAALGFRWIMPIGTIPLPFHPWLAWLLPFLIPALILHRIVSVAAGGDDGIGWRGLLIAAAVLAIPMSIPILSWLAIAFRVPLLQGLLIAGSLILLGFDAATGAAPFWVALFPAGYVSLYLVQRFGGPIALRRLEAANERFETISPGDRLVIYEQDRVSSSYGNWLVRNCAVARVAIEPDMRGRSTKLAPSTYHPFAPTDLERIAEKVQRLQPDGWSVGAGHIVTPRIADTGPAAPIRIRTVPHRSPFWMLGGSRIALRIDDGRRTRRLIGGEAALVGGTPLFVCFYYLAIFGGKSKWVFGFPRRKPVSIGTTRIYDMLARAFPARDTSPENYANPGPLLAELDRIDAEQRVEIQALVETLLDPDASAPLRAWTLIRRPQLLAGHGAALCRRLGQAKAAKDHDAVRLVAKLIALLEVAEFRSLSDELIALLDSKELAFRLIDSDDPAIRALPPSELQKHVIGGFSLIRHVPDLYERLWQLGEPARSLINGLGELGRWPEPLKCALERLDAQRPR